MQNVTDLESAVKTIVALINKDIPVWLRKNGETCREPCKILKPFEEAAVQLSGEKYVRDNNTIVPHLKTKFCGKYFKENFGLLAKIVLKKLTAGLSRFRVQ